MSSLNHPLSVVITTVVVTGLCGWIAIRQVDRLSASSVMSTQGNPVRVRQVFQPMAASDPRQPPSPRLLLQPPQPHQPSQNTSLFPQSPLSQQVRVVRAAKSVTTPASLGIFLHRLLKFGLKRRDRNPQWVGSDLVYEFLKRLSNLQTLHPYLFLRAFDHMTLHTTAMNESFAPDEEMRRIDPSRDLAILVQSEHEAHFYMMFVDSKNKEVLALDSMFKREDALIKHLLDSHLTSVRPFATQGYVLRNHTGRVCRQRGMTCGPWSVWLLTAMVMNFGGCRGVYVEGDGSRGSRVDVGMLNAFRNEDVVAFWDHALS